MELFTIGHSNHNIKTFVELLKQHKIDAIADVRSHPYSRYLPHFSKLEIIKSLEEEKIKYVFLGRKLGARPDNPGCYVEGKAVYEKIANTELFAQGIKNLLKGLRTYRIALMCAEKDPIACHRAILVCQYIKNCNLNISHIKSDGSLELHNELEDRLLKKFGFLHLFESQLELETAKQLSLFEDINPLKKLNSKSKEECLNEAYILQGNEIAYVENKE
ncbi:DUF488 domain-containing protein [Scytonema sp. NUACC21]